MPTDFVVVGVAFIVSCFYLNIKKNLLIFAGLLLTLLGYFCGVINTPIFNINILYTISLVLFTIYLFKYVEKELKKLVFYNVVTNVLIYSLLNLINVDYNIFFDKFYFILIIVIANFIFKNSIFSSIFITICSAICCEIINLFFMLPKLNFIALFSNDLIFCIVVACVIQFVIYFVISLFKRRRNEKVY